MLNNRYRIIQNLGSGGFGETFLAEDTQMPSGRLCVIKKLKPATGNPQVYQLVKERFQREATILEDLGKANPQIPELYAYFTENGEFYLAQEWIDGENLTKKVQRTGPLRESSVKQIFNSLLPVLDYVHSKRIVHRDIKPDNIILRAVDDLPVLIDFGAVKESMGTTLNSQGNPTPSIVIGTQGYMPSEQGVGRPVFASDLYSVGLTAIYLLTGKDPREFETEPLTGNIMWHQHALSVSPTLTGVLDKAIQSHQRDRYATAREMLAALQSDESMMLAMASTPSSTEVSPPPPSGDDEQQTVVVCGQSRQTSATVSGMGDWQRATIIGSAIGVFVFAGIVLSNFFQSSREPSSSDTSISQPPVAAQDHSKVPSSPSAPSSPVSPSRASVVSPSQPSLKPVYLVVDVDSDDVLYILSGAGVQHKIVGCIPYDGKDISIAGKGVTVGKYLWVPIQYKETKGWVNSRYINRYAMSGKIRSSSRTSSRYPRYRVVNVQSDDTLYIHSDPGVQTKLVGCIPYDARNVFVTGSGVTIGRSLWVPIQYQGTAGWVNSRYMTRQ